MPPVSPGRVLFLAYGDQPLLYRQYHRLGSGVSVKLAQYRGDVVLDGLLADIQDVSDLLVEVTLSHVIEDFRLSWGEGGDEGGGLLLPGEFIELLQHLFRHAGTPGKDFIDGVFPLGAAPDGLHQLGSGDVLAEVS